MAVMMVMRWRGITPAQYEQAMEEIGWERDPAPGGLYHVAAFDAEGLRVTDVWESPEQFNAFVQTRLMPGVQRLGIPGQPEVELLPAHRVYAPGYTAR
jgi:hypothetical protein